MSPAHPLGLRIASKKLNAPFIGVSQYYFYNQLKQNIVVSENTKLLNKQLVMPADQVAHLKSRFEQNNVRISEIAYPRALPTSVLLKAKQLFDSQYVLNRRRLLNITIHYAAQFQQQLDAQLYSYFTNRFFSAFYFNSSKVTANLIKQQTKKPPFPIFLFVPTKRVPQKLQMGAKGSLSGFKQKKNAVDQLVTENVNPYTSYLSCLAAKRDWIITHDSYHNCYTSAFVWLGKKVNSYTNKLLEGGDSKRSTKPGTTSIIYDFIYNFENFKSIRKKQNQPGKLDKKSKKKGKSIYLSTCLSLGKKPKSYFDFLSQQQLYAEPINNQRVSSAILLAFLSQLSPINRALYEYSTFNKYKFLPFLSLYPSPIAAACLAKEISQKQKGVYMNSASLDKINIPANLDSHVITYAVCPHSNFTTLNLKNISKKFTRQIETFRSNIILLTPLKLLIHRNFLEPVAIHYISSLDNRVAKTYSSSLLKNNLFIRTPKDYLRANYMRSRQGLIRLKDAILFEFAYTKTSLIQFDLKKTHPLIQQLLETGRTKLWLRKISSIRL